MRLAALLVTAILTDGRAFAQQAQSSQPAGAVPQTTERISDSHANRKDAAADPASTQGEGSLSLPVSLDKIREALAQPPPAEPLKGLNEQPTFRLEVQERQKIEALIDKLKFDSGPPIPGGLYSYEQQQRLFPSVDNPRLQPYGAFTSGQIVTLSIEALIEGYVAQKVSGVIGDARRAEAERQAREEVARALSEFWAAQPAKP